MSNLLPHEARKKMWRTYRTRFLIAGSCVALVSALLTAIALSPSYLVLQTAQASAPTAPAPGSPSAQADGAAIANTQALLSALSPLVEATTTPTGLIAAALSTEPAGVTVDHITLTSGPPGTIILSGEAQSIETINAYQQALQQNLDFTSVSVPVGDLAGTQNGQFSITLTGNF